MIHGQWMSPQCTLYQMLSDSFSQYSTHFQTSIHTLWMPSCMRRWNGVTWLNFILWILYILSYRFYIHMRKDAICNSSFGHWKRIKFITHCLPLGFHFISMDACVLLAHSACIVGYNECTMMFAVVPRISARFARNSNFTIIFLWNSFFLRSPFSPSLPPPPLSLSHSHSFFSYFLSFIQKYALFY